MAKIQQINRKDGTIRYTLNIPLHIVDLLHLAKGDEVDFEVVENHIILTVI